MLVPQASHVIILEEDLEVSPDFFNYFAQLKPVLEQDPSLYCISAWNDNGYSHSSADPGLLYRIETMPGLGWMLSRRLYEVSSPSVSVRAPCPLSFCNAARAACKVACTGASLRLGHVDAIAGPAERSRVHHSRHVAHLPFRLLGREYERLFPVGVL
jgi:hypothetical protein